MKKNKHDDFDGFTVNMFLDEDGDYLAHFVELPNVSAFGKTPAEALAELKQAWELMKNVTRKTANPFPKPLRGRNTAVHLTFLSMNSSTER